MKIICGCMRIFCEIFPILDAMQIYSWIFKPSSFTHWGNRNPRVISPGFHCLRQSQSPKVRDFQNKVTQSLKILPTNVSKIGVFWTKSQWIVLVVSEKLIPTLWVRFQTKNSKQFPESKRPGNPPEMEVNQNCV